MNNAPTAEEKGAFSIAYNSDQSKYGPKTCLSAVTHNWNDYYIGRVKAAIAGTWKSGDVWGGVKEGMTRLAPYNAAVPDAVRKEVDAVMAAIGAGTRKPFAGPLTDQDGKPRLAAGQQMADKDIAEMKWFVEGVQGKI